MTTSPGFRNEPEGDSRIKETIGDNFLEGSFQFSFLAYRTSTTEADQNKCCG